jgi:uncharacterized membrane protein (DUF4010 family)
LLGGLAGWFIGNQLAGVGLMLLAGVISLTVAAYVMVARQGGEAVDGTTEMAALAVLVLGVIAGLGLPLVTSAIASVMVLALAEKSRIHSFVRRLGEPELTAALQFAVLALVVLPLLPSGPYGPYDSFRPRALWAVVLLFSALNFAGYLATRALGVQRGYSLSGLLGGLVSSTAVTLQFSRRSRDHPGAGRALGLGVLGACTVVVIRVAITVAVLNSPMALNLIRYLVPVFLCGAVVFGAVYLRRDNGDVESTQPHLGNPLGLWSSLKMALAFQLVLFLVAFVSQRVGAPGVLASAAALGLTDMDALTYAMTRLGTAPDVLALGARGVAIGLLANTSLKAAIAVLVGRGEFRWIAGLGLAVLGIASGLGLWWAG